MFFFWDLKLVAYFCVCRRSTSVSPCSGSGWWLSPPTWVHPCRCWKTRRVGEVLPDELSGEKLLTRLLMDSRCLPVRSETPLFTSSSAHVRELNRGTWCGVWVQWEIWKTPPGPCPPPPRSLCSWLRSLHFGIMNPSVTSTQRLFVVFAGKRDVHQQTLVLHCFVFLYCM